jgi:hypothetical protein
MNGVMKLMVWMSYSIEGLFLLHEFLFRVVLFSFAFLLQLKNYRTYRFVIKITKTGVQAKCPSLLTKIPDADQYG